VTRAALASRLAALEQRAAKLKSRQLDVSSLTWPELVELEARFYAHHGKITYDEAWVLLSDDCYYRHETGTDDCLSPRSPEAARRAIAKAAERHRRNLQQEGVPADVAERVTTDLKLWRRTIEHARPHLPAWCRRGWPERPCTYVGAREMAQALAELGSLPS
jgi:hypothetical protein